MGNPETVHFKAKHNPKGGFSILGFRAKKGDKVVGQGALSITNFGEKDAVAKWRITGGKKGKNLMASGFVDCSQTAEPISIVPSFINKKLGLNMKSGKTAKSNIEINGSKFLQLLPDGKLGDIANMQESLNMKKYMETVLKNIGKAY